MAITVGKLAKMFGVSRTALLFYDSIGLLKPSGKSKSGYRLYNQEDVNKLGDIIVFKEIGTPLDEISVLLSSRDEHELSHMLIRRLHDLNKEIEALKKQQEFIVKMMRNGGIYHDNKKIDKSIWLQILKSAGINEDTAYEWHAIFERNSAEQHEEFLAMIGISKSEISQWKDEFIKSTP